MNLSEQSLALGDNVKAPIREESAVESSGYIHLIRSFLLRCFTQKGVNTTYSMINGFDNCTWYTAQIVAQMCSKHAEVAWPHEQLLARLVRCISLIGRIIDVVNR